MTRPEGSRPGVDLDAVKRVDLLGIGGAGMSALARLLLARGYQVTGADQRESRTVATLRALGADVRPGHDGHLPGPPDLVVVSTAIRADNVDLAAARALGLPVLGRARLLALLMAGKVGIVVAGTHGKTTTTSMVTAILQAAGFDPSFAVGGDLKASGTNAGAGGGPHFIAEADESDGSFLEFTPTVAVVTNVEADHLDYYAGLPAVQAAFRAFLGLLPGHGTAVLCADDAGTRALADAPRCPVVTYGLADGAVRAADVELSGAGSRFVVVAGGEVLGALRLVVPGRHNVQNALAAVAASRAVGAPFAAAQEALGGFRGAARRFELRAEVAGVTIVDDYAHHPTEIAAILATATLGPWRRVVAVFQPHRYSRTRAFAAEFGRVLAGADVVVVTDVYGAGELPEPGVDGLGVADAAAAARPGLDCHYVADRGKLAGRVAALLRPGDLLLSLGAGDITTLADELVGLLAAPAAKARGDPT